MKLTLTGRYKPHGLMDELLDRFPEWRGEPAPPEWGLPPGCLVNPKLSIQSKALPDSDARTVWLEFPDDTDLAVVEAITAAHDPDAETKSERGARERREALAAVKADPKLANLARALGL
jgi:hypothetical protein